MDIYENLWQDAASAFARGEPQIDLHLLDKPGDLRRGVTLALRPSRPVCGRVGKFLDEMAVMLPGQYCYRPEELHMTVLSIISGAETWRKHIRQLPTCRAIIRDVLSRQHSFKLCFRGVTASPGSVMIQGFPLCDELARIREALRQAFGQGGFGEMLDRRYKISAAHMTAVRFCKPDGDWKRLASLLTENRQRDFGVMEVDHLQLLWGDWYASAGIERTLQEYQLNRPSEGAGRPA